MIWEARPNLYKEKVNKGRRRNHREQRKTEIEIVLIRSCQSCQSRRRQAAKEGLSGRRRHIEPHGKMAAYWPHENGCVEGCMMAPEGT